jgi:NAD(P)H-hydrate repair Nnr-like enzyme with NAD(P)H-hydrate epimerase domain
MPYENAEDNDLDDKVKLLLVHDQQVSEVREDYAAQWAITQTELMEKAAMYVYPQGAANQTSWTTGPKDKTTKLQQNTNKQRLCCLGTGHHKHRSSAT